MGQARLCHSTEGVRLTKAMMWPSLTVRQNLWLQEGDKKIQNTDKEHSVTLCAFWEHSPRFADSCVSVSWPSRPSRASLAFHTTLRSSSGQVTGCQAEIQNGQG